MSNGASAAQRVKAKRTRKAKPATDAASGLNLGAVSTLQQFLSKAGELTIAEREQIVDQALVLIEQIYVHLPLKRAMHAVDPVQRLRLVRRRLAGMGERRFHDEMIATFTCLRDLHTNYILPSPFQGKTAFLPFLIEDYAENGERRYLVSKTFDGFNHATFKAGVLITHWNGIPIARAVELNADRNAGSNEPARLARGLESMTIRPMSLSSPPDEHWVVVSYVADGQPQTIQLDWRVFEPDPSPGGVDASDASNPAALALGIDELTELSRRAKKALFSRNAMIQENRFLQGDGPAVPADLNRAEESTLPDVFSFRTLSTAEGDYGYIRIWTFNHGDVDEFVNEFVRILGELPQKGLIIDVRSNGGGVITAGEALLQLLTPRRIEGERLHFLNTPLTLRIAQSHSSLRQWEPSIAQAVETGATFSQGFPIGTDEEYNQLGQRYCGPVVLITDALCYSTTDIFAAGFQDHEIGTILGVGGNTGAGGANVWTLDLLRQIVPSSQSPFRRMPKNANFRVSIRRTTRVGSRSGVPVEDLGVEPDELHEMTRNDLLNGNQDLLAKAVSLLRAMPVRSISATVQRRGQELDVTVSTSNVNRLDFYLDGRPQTSVDVADGETTVTLANRGGAARELELRGFAQGGLVAIRRVAIG